MKLAKGIHFQRRMRHKSKFWATRKLWHQAKYTTPEDQTILTPIISLSVGQ